MRSGVRGAPDVGAMASIDGHRLCLFVWHYHDDDVPGPAARVTIQVRGLPVAAGRARLAHYRIDGEHSNSYHQWQLFGSPTAPNEAQYAAMEQAGQLTLLAEPSTVSIQGGSAELTFTLPRQAVSLVELDW
jgi:xylan 1,4-beta-xylosidase